MTYGDDYVRAPARPLALVAHHKPADHPQQVHISMEGNHHMRVCWVTHDHDPDLTSWVEYGTSHRKYTVTVHGNHTTYSYGSYHSGKIHHATIGPLKSSTTYYYRCGKAGDEFCLRTPPAKLPIEFVVIGDLGQTQWTKSTLSHIQDTSYDMLLLPGDLSYADGDQTRWDSFGRLVQPLASARPWMVTEGNHEKEPHNDHKFVAYNHRWQMPHEESDSSSNLYYSFDAAGGAVHVLMLGSYAHFNKGSEQRAWLKRDLAGVDRHRTPWLVALLHAPWYNTNKAHKHEGEDMRKSMESLLYDAHVDIVFSGHVHAYERFTTIYNNSYDSMGPVYITIGDGGNREGPATKFTRDHELGDLSVFREASFGHGRLRILDDKTAKWKWHRNHDDNASVADEVLLHSWASKKSAHHHHHA